MPALKGTQREHVSRPGNVDCVHNVSIVRIRIAGPALFILWKYMGLEYSSVDRTPKHHAADAGSIPRCGEGFSPRVHFSMQTLTHVRTPLCAMNCINICAHVKDLVVHVIYGNTKTPSIHHKLGRATLSWLSFPGKGQPEFHIEEIPKGHFIRTVLLQF